jgi:phage baseplate assembly protein W
MADDIIGAGIKFPLQITQQGGVAWSANPDPDKRTNVERKSVITSSYSKKIYRPKGTKAYHRDEGNPAHDALFMPLSDDSVGKIMGFGAKEELNNNEPRATVLSVTTTTDTTRKKVTHKFLALINNKEEPIVITE